MMGDRPEIEFVSVGTIDTSDIKKELDDYTNVTDIHIPIKTELDSSGEVEDGRGRSKEYGIFVKEELNSDSWKLETFECPTVKNMETDDFGLHSDTAAITDCKRYPEIISDVDSLTPSEKSVHINETQHSSNDSCIDFLNDSKDLSTTLNSPNEEVSYHCNICNKAYIRKSDLNRHTKIHTGVKPYQCDVCCKSFWQKTQLGEHIRIHSGEKPFYCDVCNRSFTRKSHLNEHVKTHTGTKPFNCSICKKSFSRNSSLNFHVRTHTGEKPFQCDICVRSFPRKALLNEHLKVHTGGKQFRCDTCNKSFMHKYHLNEHVKIHMPNKPFQCNICNKPFPLKSHLNKHIKAHIGT